ncbi:MAG TPA: group III truncated hemoglobin [Chitinophagaceae bacterium]|nr:group III truncated hemoglobin [Chitinophagaceae bacterium]
MKKDIKTREDIELLVQTFYDKAKTDPVIGHIFTTVFKINWEKHLQVMFDFWENTLFFTGSYTGNPIESHRRIHKIFPLNDEHFKQWVVLFTETVDELFEGEKALLAKQRAFSISTVMKIKILPQIKAE